METKSQQSIEDLAKRYGVSPQAVTTLLEAVTAGHGTMAQFNHPELGGFGQWSNGGMTMVGDMFNDALKAKVNALCSDLSHLVRNQSSEAQAESPAPAAPNHGWWGVDLGPANASGSQNDMRYAYFATARRLAIKTADGLTIYDTGDHQIRGVSQQQSGDASLRFVSQHGVVPVAALRVVR
jgi:hypothetical protein